MKISRLSVRRMVLVISVSGLLASCESEPSVSPESLTSDGDAHGSDAVEPDTTAPATVTPSPHSSTGVDLEDPGGFHRAPYAGWHPLDDEEHEWVHGLWELPYPGFDDSGRLVDPCDEESTLLERCFGLCTLPVRGSDLDEIYPCNECQRTYGYAFGGRFPLFRGRSNLRQHHHWECGTRFFTCGCEGPEDDLYFWCDVPIEGGENVPSSYWPHLFIELDEATRTSVEACWFRLPGPEDVMGQPQRWPGPGFRTHYDMHFVPALQRALAMEEEAGSGSAADSREHEETDGEPAATDSDSGQDEGEQHDEPENNEGSD